MLATNLCDNIDKAIHDRSKVIMFAAPDLKQCTIWWEQHARQVLDFIGRQTGACLFIDEADALLGDRQAAADSQSVEVRKSHDMISRYLEWSDGLQTQQYADGQAPVVMLATNLCDNIDKAIHDRSKVIMFAAPDLKQCTIWWEQHARQLKPMEVKILGWLSFLLRMKFDR